MLLVTPYHLPSGWLWSLDHPARHTWDHLFAPRCRLPRPVRSQFNKWGVRLPLEPTDPLKRDQPQVGCDPSFCKRFTRFDAFVPMKFL